MKNDAGKDDVIRFIYGEMTPEEAGDFETRLQIDPECHETYEELKHVQVELNSLRCSPSNALLNSIMRYARQPKPVDERQVSKGIA